MKFLIFLGLVSTALAAGSPAAPVEVFTSGVVESTAERFTDAKTKFTFTSLPAGEFKKPEVIQYVMLDVPYSIRSERSDHSVDVGVILSDQGKVLATCTVSSNCKALEGAAQKYATAIKIRPASLNGRPVNFFLILPVSYKYADK